MSEFKKDLSVQIISGVIVAIITAIASGLITNYFTKKILLKQFLFVLIQLIIICHTNKPYKQFMKIWNN